MRSETPSHVQKPPPGIERMTGGAAGLPSQDSTRRVLVGTTEKESLGRSFVLRTPLRRGSSLGVRSRPNRLRKKLICSEFLFAVVVVSVVEGLDCQHICRIGVIPCSSGHTSAPTYTARTGAARLRMRTRLYAAQAKVKIQSTRHTPRCRTLRINAIVFNQPKHSSIRFRFFWLMA